MEFLFCGKCGPEVFVRFRIAEKNMACNVCGSRDWRGPRPETGLHPRLESGVNRLLAPPPEEAITQQDTFQQTSESGPTALAIGWRLEPVPKSAFPKHHPPQALNEESKEELGVPGCNSGRDCIGYANNRLVTLSHGYVGVWCERCTKVLREACPSVRVEVVAQSHLYELCRTAQTADGARGARRLCERHTIECCVSG